MLLFPRFWIIFTIITLNSVLGRLPISSSLNCSLGFYLVPLSGTYSSAFSFCLTFCDCSFHSTGCRVVVLAFAVSPVVDEAGLRGLCRLPGGRDWFLPTGGWSWVLTLYWAKLGLVHLVGKAMSGGSFGLRETLVILSADGWG